jgi:hypothetical protein
MSSIIAILRRRFSCPLVDALQEAKLGDPGRTPLGLIDCAAEPQD